MKRMEFGGALSMLQAYLVLQGLSAVLVGFHPTY